MVKREPKIKSAKQIERHIKGISNHWRIDMLMFIEMSSPVTLEEIVEALNINVKTASEHTRRLVHAGLVNKKYSGRSVEHSLTPYGKYFARFIYQFRKTF